MRAFIAFTSLFFWIITKPQLIQSVTDSKLILASKSFQFIKNDTAKLNSILRHLNEEYYEYPVIEYMDNLLKKNPSISSIESNPTVSKKKRDHNILCLKLLIKFNFFFFLQ